MARDFSDPEESTSPLNLNTASKDQLARHQSVGPELAELIVRHRPFKDWDDAARALGNEGAHGLRAGGTEISGGGLRAEGARIARGGDGGGSRLPGEPPEPRRPAAAHGPAEQAP